MSETTAKPRKRAPSSARYIQQCGKNSWRVRIKREGKEYRKRCKTYEEAYEFLEEMKRILPPMRAQKTKGNTCLFRKDYEAIRAACEEGREENLAKYRSMADEARVADEADRARRDAAAARIRELQALLGIRAS